MDQAIIDDVFGGLEFTKENLEQISEQNSKRKRKKATRDEQEALYPQLLDAIEDKNVDDVRRILELGVVPKGNGPQGERLEIFAINNFDQDVFQLLIDHKMKLGYASSCFRAAYYNDNAAAFSFLMKNYPNLSPSEYDLRQYLYSAMIRQKPNMSNFLLGLKTAKGDSYLKDMAHYSLARLLKIISSSKSGEQVYQSLFGAIDRHPEIRKALERGLTDFARSATYTDALKLQDVIARHPEHRLIWTDVCSGSLSIAGRNISETFEKGNFNSYRGRENASARYHDIVELFVLQGAPVVEQIAKTEQGRKKLQKMFQNSNILTNFFNRADRPVAYAVIKNMASELSSLVYDQGNTVGHVAIAEMGNSRAVAEVLYSAHKGWLTTPNDQGVTPLSKLDNDDRAHMENKVMRKDLNEIGLGLRAARVAKPKKRMM